MILPVYIKDKLQAQLDLYPDAEIYITQGFICRNAYGEIDNLQRGIVKASKWLFVFN